MSDEIFIPPNAIRLDTTDYNFQLRVGLQGPSGYGKTHAGTTFPNPVFFSYDRGLIAHIGRPDIIELPFYNGRYVDSLKPRTGPKDPPDRKEALMVFLYGDALKLTEKQTLIFDANTGMQSAYHAWWRINQNSFISKSGEVDERKQWRLKLDHFTEIYTALKALRCNVVVIFHESPDRNDKGDLNGGVRPLLTGQFQDELQTHFTDFFRCLALPKPKANDPESFKKFKSHFGLSEEEAQEWLKTGTKDSIFVWQTQADQLCACKTSRYNCPKFILADYKSFAKYQKNPEVKS